MRGAALIELGRLDEAEVELDRVAQLIGRKVAQAHLHRARIYEKRGQRARAADELENYLREAPNAENAQAIRQATRKLRSK